MRNLRNLHHLTLALNPEVMQWVSSFATCAIEGNRPGMHMCELWNSGEREQFAKELADWLDGKTTWSDHGWVKVRTER